VRDGVTHAAAAVRLAPAGAAAVTPAPRSLRAPPLPVRPGLADLLAAARLHSAAVAEARANVALARLDRTDAWLAALPALEARAGYAGASAHDRVPHFVAANAQEEYTATIGLSLPVFDGGAYGAGLRASGAVLARAAAEARATSLELALRVRVAYHDAVRAGAEAGALRALEARLADLIRYIELARGQGLAAEIDANRSTLVATAVRNRRAAAEAERQRALAVLASLAGADRVDDVAAPPAFAGPPLPLGPTGTAALVEEAIAASPELRAARAAVDAAAAEVDRARAGHLPSIDARIDAGFDTGGFPTRGDLGFSASVVATVPIFSWGRISREVERAEERLRAARARAALAEQAIRRDAQAAAIDHDLAVETLARGLDALAASARIVEQSRVGFENGALTNLEVLDAWQSYTDAEIAVEEGRRDLRVALARIDRLTGREE
jgi:outer membrane protein TolC